MAFDRRPLMAGNWKMYKTQAEAVAFVQAFQAAGRRRRRPRHAALRTVHGASGHEGRGAWDQRDGRRPEHALRARRRLHGRDRGGDAGRGRRRRRDPRPLRAPPVLRRERRRTRPEGARGARRRLLPVLCCGESDAEREAGKTEDKVGGQIDAGLAQIDRRRARPCRGRLRADLGDRHRQDGDPEMAQETVGFIRGRLAARASATPRRPSRASSMAAASRRRTSTCSWRSPTSTGCSSAAPVSTPPSSRASFVSRRSRERGFDVNAAAQWREAGGVGPRAARRRPLAGRPYLPSGRADGARRVGLRRAGAGQRGHARRHAGLRPALGELPPRDARGLRRGRRAAARARWATPRSAT